MFDRKQILQAIVSLAKKLGHAPSILEFTAHVKISRYSLFRLFPKWNAAVRAAGLKPHRLHVRPDDSQLLKDWGEVVRKKRAIPSPWTYRLNGKYYSLTLAKRFGGWDSLPQAFRRFARRKPEWKDVLALLPATGPTDGRVAVAPCRGALQRVPAALVRAASKVCPYKKLNDRSAYGNPIDFPGFRHEPVNEQGVVLLFGMLAKELGYSIEAVQKGFPDCEAKRQIAPDRWQRVLIEFEFESKNFHQHGHPHTGCDVIVCWRHNWAACPPHLEVVELCSVIQSLSNPED